MYDIYLHTDSWNMNDLERWTGQSYDPMKTDIKNMMKSQVKIRILKGQNSGQPGSGRVLPMLQGNTTNFTYY